MRPRIPGWVLRAHVAITKWLLSKLHYQCCSKNTPGTALITTEVVFKVRDSMGIAARWRVKVCAVCGHFIKQERLPR